jgi:hypothetical protein
MKKLILVLLLTPLLAQAAKWSKLGAGAETSTYIDKGSITKSGAGQKAWSLVSFSSEQATQDGKPYKAIKALHLYSCEERTVTLLSEVFYADAMGKGEPVQSLKYEKFLPEDIVPDSVPDAALTVVCKK